MKGSQTDPWRHQNHLSFQQYPPFREGGGAIHSSAVRWATSDVQWVKGLRVMWGQFMKKEAKNIVPLSLETNIFSHSTSTQYMQCLCLRCPSRRIVSLHADGANALSHTALPQYVYTVIMKKPTVDFLFALSHSVACCRLCSFQCAEKSQCKVRNEPSLIQFNSNPQGFNFDQLG